MKPKTRPWIRIRLLIFLLAAAFAITCTVPAVKKPAVPLSSSPATPLRVSRYSHDGYIIARASLHNHTVYSDGCRTPEDLLELGFSEGISILAYTDHREGKVCYGNLICTDNGGVSSHGYGEYYEHLGRIQVAGASREMLVLKGVEVSPPYFRNHGYFPAMVLRGLPDHFVVYGVSDPSVFESMPVRDWVPATPETDFDDAPYREFVDYLDKRGALVHCAHPDWAPDGWLGPVHKLGEPPIHHALIPGLSAFAVLPEGFKVVPEPGGLWDLTLSAYLSGMRNRPLWVSGDADYHCSGSLANATTLFYLEEFSEDEVYGAMRSGRMVALQGEVFQDVYVSEWNVSTGVPDREVMLGREVRISGVPVIRFSLSRQVEDCFTLLIRNGVVVHKVAGTELTFADEDLGSRAEPAFYRAQVVGPVDDSVPYESPTMPESLLYVNPIFVRFSG